MTIGIETYQKQQGKVRGEVLVLIAFATAFFPRILNSVGAPPVINFAHFVVVPLVCGIILSQTRVKDRRQIDTLKALLVSLLILLIIMIASATLNGAGAINVFLDFMLLTEPFILLVSILSIPVSKKGFSQLRRWILGFALFHLFLCHAQWILLSLGILKYPRLTINDNVQGVFYLSNGGHVIAASVSLFVGLYYLANVKKAPLWLRVSVIFTVILQIFFADAKQVLLVAFVGWFLLIVSRVKNIRVTLQYTTAAIVLIYIFYLCVQSIPFLSPYMTWVRPEIYGSDGDATVLKSTPLRVIPLYFDSALNWFFGLGPGHTIGRLGGWMIRDYSSLLEPLGATSNPALVNTVWATWYASYLDSSMFSPFWGFAGIWGDLGLLGLAAYLYIWLVVLNRLCPDDFSRFIAFNVLINGLIFTLLEEPGFTLSVAVLIGLCWQDRQLAQQQRQQERQAVYTLQASMQ